MNEVRYSLRLLARNAVTLMAEVVVDTLRGWPCRPGPILPGGLPLTTPNVGDCTESDVVA